MKKKLLIGIAIPFLFFTLLLSNWKIISNLTNLINVTIKNIVIDGKNYNLENGRVSEDRKELSWLVPSQREKISKVLGFASFYMWSKEDPLLTSPDFNTKDFESSIQLLEKQSRDFQKDMNLKYDIFPIKFLYSTIKAKDASDAFLSNPNQANTRNLIHAQKETINYYKQDIAQRIKLIELNINDKNIDENILYMQLATNPRIIVKDYKTLLSNAAVLEKELKQREECLNGKSFCKRPSEDFVHLYVTLDTPPTAQILNDDLLITSYPNVIQTRTGPFEVSTPCLGLNEDLGEKKQAYFSFIGADNYPQLDHRNSMYTKPATEVYLRRIDDNIVKDRIFREKGVTIWGPVSGTQTYGCPDLSYLAKIITMNSYINKITSQPLFGDMPLTGMENLDKIIKNGQTLEKKIITSRVKDYDDFSSLGNLYLQFYSKVYSNDKLTSLQGKADIFLNYGLGMQRLLTDFHLIFNRTIQEFISLSIYQRLDNLDKSNLYLYGIRDIPSFSFFSFSKSFFRTDQSLLHYKRVLVNNIGFNNRYLTYSLAITRYTKDEIVSWFQPVADDIYNSYIEWKSEQ